MNSKINEYVEYLSAWCRTRDGKYVPYDLKNLKEELINIVIQGNTEPIKTFKKKFLNKEISFPIFCIGLMPNREKELYNKCLKVVSDFEASHNNM